MKARDREPPKTPQIPPIPPPVDVVDGVPDRSPKPSRWKYIVIAAIFLAWVAFLIYVLLSGR